MVLASRRGTSELGERLRYLSCFSGIGGLEASEPPLLFCEADESAASVLRALHPGVEVAPDVQTHNLVVVGSSPTRPTRVEFLTYP